MENVIQYAFSLMGGLFRHAYQLMIDCLWQRGQRENFFSFVTASSICIEVEQSPFIHFHLLIK